MKKTLKVIALIFIFTLVIGCGKEKEKEVEKKELSCTIEIADEMNSEIISRFVDKAYDSGTLIFNIDTKSYSESEKKKLKEQDLCSVFQDAYKYDTKKCKVSEKDDSIKITVDFDVYEFIHEDLKKENEDIGDEVYKLNLDDTKEIFESAGYTCKVK